MTDPKATILIVDDNRDNLFVLESLLTHMGHEVIQAKNGAEAISQAAEHLPDLILMDLDMPVMNGWDASEQIRNSAPTSRIPIVALSAHALLGDQEETLKGAIDDFIPKPFAPQQVLNKVSDVLSGNFKRKSGPQ